MIVISGAQIADTPLAWPVDSSTVLAEGGVGRFVQDRVRTPDGDVMTREYVRHPGAVGVIALDDHERVALVRQYRHPVRHRLVEPPAGLLDVDGEDYLVAAQRELAEEADLVASEWAVLADVATSPGGSDEVIRVYLARGLTATPEPYGREAEEADMETRWVPLDECVEAVLTRRIHNAPLAIAVLVAQAARARGWQTLGEADAPWPNRSRPRQEPAAP